MQAQKNFLPQLLMFHNNIQGPEEQSLLNEGSLQVLLGGHLQMLQQLAKFVQELQALCLNILCQLGAICAEQTRKHTIYDGKNSGDPAPWLCAGHVALLGRRSDFA